MKPRTTLTFPHFPNLSVFLRWCRTAWTRHNGANVWWKWRIWAVFDVSGTRWQENSYVLIKGCKIRTFWPIIDKILRLKHNLTVVSPCSAWKSSGLVGFFLEITVCFYCLMDFINPQQWHKLLIPARLFPVIHRKQTSTRQQGQNMILLWLCVGVIWKGFTYL